MRERSWVAVSVGVWARINAATPDTYGADADVPYPKRYVGLPVVKSQPGPRTPPPPLSSRRKSPPGAETEMNVPALEYVASAPSMPTAAIPITPEKPAGYSGKSSPSLPADATMSDPAAIAALTAVRSVALGDPPPRLMLMI